ncbi:hypothetical protein LTR84_006567 [Exophiala bonariae]|uniref:SnoaL-like domain-containing protein n=1 Tax=Exophiala bonariae TaxID=1690606 RepID=A0AAV9N0F6_9EURO|nr:hypothetical protein LTR84_006567 [Exophiala bonariae]
MSATTQTAKAAPVEPAHKEIDINSLVASVRSEKEVNANVDVNANDLINLAMNELFPRFGSTVDNGDYIAYFNDWQSRDTAAHAFNTFDTGRFSFAGKLQGRWYACRKSS